jgi:hypothetical protein
MYVSTLAVGPPGQAILVSSSSDSGRSWSPPVAVRKVGGGSAILDKPALLVDARRPATAYVVWVEYRYRPGESLTSLRVDTAFISRTTDGGKRWSAPMRLYGADTENQNHVLGELDNGTLVDVFAEAYRLSPPSTPERVRDTNSSDGGRTWSRPRTVARLPFGVVSLGAGGPRVRASSQDIAAFVAGSAVYAGWEQSSEGHSQIGVAQSLNGGRTWRRLPDPVNGPGAVFLPSLSVDAGGTIATTWYQVTSPRGGAPTTLQLALLRPGARNWSTRRLAGPFRLTGAPTSPQGYFVGDYDGLVSSGCGFRALSSVVTPTGARVATIRGCG